MAETLQPDMEYTCRRCSSKQQAVSCGDCQTTVCVICYERCPRCDKTLCDKHFERAASRGGICDGCLKVRRDYLREAQRIFEHHLDENEAAGQDELALVFKRAGNILHDMERWEAKLERRRTEIEMLPDMRIDELTRQLKELQEEEVALHAARRAAEDAAASKSRFVAHVSHEIRTPMNAVVAMADLLAGTNLDDQQRKYVNTVRRSGDHLVRIVGDILDNSKLEAGRLSIEAEPFNLEATCAEAVEILAPKAAEKEVPIVFRYAPDAARRLLGDAARLRQVLLNLLGNAIKFTHSGSILLSVDQLGVSQGRAVMRITVLDTGIGIPQDKYPAIFERFDQGNATTYGHYGGTGLGLSITAQLVRLMGGRIGLTSREGNGTRFRITLAMESAPDQAQPAERETPFANQRTIIADPIPASAEFLARQARWLGARVVLTSTIKKAIEQLVTAQEENDPFDAVWLHHLPPELDATRLAGALRKSELLPQKRMVCFSSAGTEENRSLFEELGFSAYFHGPCLTQDITETLKRSDGSAARRHMAVVQSSSHSGDDTGQVHEQFPGCEVLIVDDRPVNQEVSAAMLESMGCSITIAGDGMEAIRLCRERQFDIVFMDCQMPEIDGYEATRRIRAEGYTAPVVAMTAHVQNGYREQCLQAGMDDYIPKPATRQQIASAMQRLLHPPDGPGLEAAPAETAQAVPQSNPVLDRWSALQSLGQNAEILERVSEVFFRTVPDEVRELCEAVREGRLEEVERIAHSIKSAAGALGGFRVQIVAERLESAGRNRDLDEVRRIYAVFEREFNAFVEELRSVQWAEA